jgi:lipopolysaccharide export system protein LptA
MKARAYTGCASRRLRRACAALALGCGLGLSTATLAETPQGAPASAGSAIGLDTAFFKSDQPIEITADRLDVDQVNKRAVFGGNVNAVQGDVHLAGELLTVFYDEKSEGAAAPPAATDAQDEASEARDGDQAAGAGARIRRMEVTGGVHVSSPTETATGDQGIYDLEAGTITLNGNVILTRGENILRGSQLNIDVESGKSVIIGAADSGRVKGLFMPKSQTANRPSIRGAE